MRIVLRLIFYMSGIFYNLETRLPAEYSKILFNGNPMAVFFKFNEKSINISATNRLAADDNNNGYKYIARFYGELKGYTNMRMDMQR